jgi:hypothetical protein
MMLTNENCNNSYDEDSSSVSSEDEDFSPCYDLMRKRPFGMVTHNINEGPTKRCRLDSWDRDSDDDTVEEIFLSRIRSSSSEMSDVTNFEPSSLPKKLHAITLTEDHTPYNENEANLVRKRCNNAPRAIASSSSGGIQRVGGSLSVTRALGDAYLKTPTLSFEPYRDHAPYITALPEVSSRVIDKKDRILVLASDGVWERVNEEDVKHCIGEYYKTRRRASSVLSSSSSFANKVMGTTESDFITAKPFHRGARMSMLPTRSLWKQQISNDDNRDILAKKSVSDAIVSNVLNRVWRRHKMTSLKTLMDLPKGYDRRIKHDDITNMVIDLEGFIL